MRNLKQIKVIFKEPDSHCQNFYEIISSCYCYRIHHWIIYHLHLQEIFHFSVSARSNLPFLEFHIHVQYRDTFKFCNLSSILYYRTTRFWTNENAHMCHVTIHKTAITREPWKIESCSWSQIVGLTFLSRSISCLLPGQRISGLRPSTRWPGNNHTYFLPTSLGLLI